MVDIGATLDRSTISNHPVNIQLSTYIHAVLLITDAMDLPNSRRASKYPDKLVITRAT